MAWERGGARSRCMGENEEGHMGKVGVATFLWIWPTFCDAPPTVRHRMFTFCGAWFLVRHRKITFCGAPHTLRHRNCSDGPSSNDCTWDPQDICGAWVHMRHRSLTFCGAWVSMRHRKPTFCGALPPYAPQKCQIFRGAPPSMRHRNISVAHQLRVRHRLSTYL